MVNLNKFVREKVEEAPRQFIKEALKRKLKKKGIKNSDMAEALAGHILDGSTAPFSWDDGKEGSTQHLNIEFTAEDSDDILNALDEFIEKGLPKAIRKTVKKSAKTLSRTLVKQWPEYRVEEQCDLECFKRRLELRWSDGLDPLRMLLRASREVGQNFSERLERSKAKKGILKREALMLLHIRACQTTNEVLVLLENGLADGAYARWRTLYEISVVAFLIDRFGDEIAERYLMHDAVSIYESMKNEFRYHGVDYHTDKLDDDSQLIEDEFQSAIQKYGKSFAGPYGWAAFSLGKKSPRFQNLEEAVDWESLPPDYKWSSFKIHAGVVGTTRSLGMIGDEAPFISGSSNAGLETPAMNTAYSLLHVTSLMFGSLQNIETQIQMQSMINLRDRVVKQCRKAAGKLVRDEIKFQKNDGLKG